MLQVMIKGGGIDQCAKVALWLLYTWLYGISNLFFNLLNSFIMKKSIFILLLGCIPMLIQAQSGECQVPDFPSSTDVGTCANTTVRALGNPCGDDLAYAPHIPEHTPIKTVRIVTHVIQRGNGSDNFQENNSDHEKFLYEIFNDKHLSANVLYSETKPNPLSGSPHIVDTRIRFQTDFENDLFFWQDDAYFCEGGVG
ncbi:MAG: hypothetical protein ACI8YQ_003837 [Polaribacter sp.]|jgi:hypothetical protein